MNHSENLRTAELTEAQIKLIIDVIENTVDRASSLISLRMSEEQMALHLSIIHKLKYPSCTRYGAYHSRNGHPSA